MQLLYETKKEKTFQMEDEKYVYEYKLLDMGNYIGSARRDIFDKVPNIWKGSFLTSISKSNPEENYRVETIYDNQGRMLRMLIECGEDIRTMFWSYDIPRTAKSLEDLEHNFGRGTHITDDGKVLTDTIRMGREKFAYDYKSNKFLNNSMDEYQGQILTDPDLVPMIMSDYLELEQSIQKTK